MAKYHQYRSLWERVHDTETGARVLATEHRTDPLSFYEDQIRNDLAIIDQHDGFQDDPERMQSAMAAIEESSADHLWHRDGQPYYCLLEELVEPFSQFDISKLRMRDLPLIPPLAVHLPIDKPLSRGEHTMRSFIVKIQFDITRLRDDEWLPAMRGELEDTDETSRGIFVSADFGAHDHVRQNSLVPGLSVSIRMAAYYRAIVMPKPDLLLADAFAGMKPIDLTKFDEAAMDLSYHAMQIAIAINAIRQPGGDKLLAKLVPDMTESRRELALRIPGGFRRSRKKHEQDVRRGRQRPHHYTPGEF